MKAFELILQSPYMCPYSVCTWVTVLSRCLFASISQRHSCCCFLC